MSRFCYAMNGCVPKEMTKKCQTLAKYSLLTERSTSVKCSTSNAGKKRNDFDMMFKLLITQSVN